jgi:hypothetical protein
MVNFVGNTLKLSQQLGILAAIEGAIYGDALGELYFVGRNATDNALKVTLDYDDIEVLETDFFYKAAYSYAQVDHATQSATAEKTVQRDGTSIIIDFDQNYIYRADNVNTTLDTCDEVALDSDVVDSGAANYGLAFGFDKTSRVKVVASGFNSIYPYSVINFDSEAPSIYQNRDYRIAKVGYDFVNNQIELDLYEI